MVKLTQIDFGGGMNAFQPSHRISDTEYPLGFNIRIRDNQPTSIRAPLHDTKAPVGKKQGLYGFNNYLLLFNGGRAYFKDTLVASSTWQLAVGVVLDPNVDTIYVQAVPRATNNFVRLLQAEDIINGTGANTRVDTINELIVSGVPAGAVVQDGVSDPYFIFIEDGIVQGRKLNNYEQWTKAVREYVPRGKQMAYMNGILFIVALDGKSIYRSVSGRPLDFVVNITNTGDKGGDADTTSYAVSGDPITSLISISSGELLVGTLQGCYPVELNYESTIFQEPTFLNRRRFDAGIVNQFSFIETLGDYNFIDQDGIRSFNAVSQLQNEGRNSVFSLKVTGVLENLKQSLATSAAFVFDNYAFFAVQTEFGHGVLVYDTLRQVWASVDIYEISQIKQFAATKLNIEPALHIITERDVYTLFAHSEHMPATIHSRHSTADDPQMELKLHAIRCVFADASSDTSVSVTEYSNGRIGANIRQILRHSAFGIQYPATYPVFYGNKESLKNLRFPFDGQSRTGFKVGASIEWQNNAKLLQLQAEYATVSPQSPIAQRGDIYASAS